MRAVYQFKRVQRIRYAIANFLGKLPPELRDSAEVKALNGISDHKVYNLAHLIYHAKNYEQRSRWSTKFPAAAAPRLRWEWM